MLFSSVVYVKSSSLEQTGTTLSLSGQVICPNGQLKRFYFHYCDGGWQRKGIVERTEALETLTPEEQEFPRAVLAGWLRCTSRHQTCGLDLVLTSDRSVGGEVTL